MTKKISTLSCVFMSRYGGAYIHTKLRCGRQRRGDSGDNSSAARPCGVAADLRWMDGLDAVIGLPCDFSFHLSILSFIFHEFFMLLFTVIFDQAWVFATSARSFQECAVESAATAAAAGAGGGGGGRFFLCSKPNLVHVLRTRFWHMSKVVYSPLSKQALL